LVKYRFWIGLIIALLWGTYTGITYPYASLFGGNSHLYTLLIIPCIALGILSGWRTILNCALLHFVVTALFFIRALIGHQLSLDYVRFVFHLITGSVLEVLPQALAWGYLSALVAWGLLFLWKKAIKAHSGAQPVIPQ
jgi:hypothetical protein